MAPLSAELTNSPDSQELDRNRIPDGIDGVVEIGFSKDVNPEMISAGAWAEKKAAEQAAREALGVVFEPKLPTHEKPARVIDLVARRAANVRQVRENAPITGYVAPEILARKEAA